MSRSTFTCLFLFVLVSTLPAVGLATDAAPDPDRSNPYGVEDIPGVEGGGLFLDGRVYLAGQPGEEALAELGRRGVGVVVNVRTPGEMDDREKVPFDEAKVVGGLGLEYVTIPLGGDDYPYGPDAVERFAETLACTDGSVLIHCGYGSRAAYLWIAYQVRYEGVPLSQAMARAEKMMLKQHAIGRLLGQPTQLALVEAAQSPH